MTTCGVSNNNPRNIDYNPRHNLQGQLGLELGVPKPRFTRFGTRANVIRGASCIWRTVARVACPA